MESNATTKALRTQATRAPVRVLVVDDSALMRRMISEILQQDPDIVVVGGACDPYVAREMIKKLNPDVITLDVEMPRMDGIQFLRNLMRLHPLPVVMVSALTTQGADVTLEALEIGAVDFVSKPTSDLKNTLSLYAEEIVRKVKAASRARIKPYSTGETKPVVQKVASVGPHQAVAPLANFNDRIIAIGASTGGTEAIKDLLMTLPPRLPGIVIAQHIPEQFSASFARRLDSVCPQHVCQAEDGQPIQPGCVYVAPGNHHLRVERSDGRWVCRVDQSEPVNRHRPSVCVLFNSVARNLGPKAIGVILTGMGDDGAEGIKRMREAGAYTIAQDEATSVVWGMPGQAVKRGGIDEILPLDGIGSRIISKLHVA